MKHVFDDTLVRTSLPPAVITASANGSAVDTKGYDNGMVEVLAGVIDVSSGNETYVFTLEESDDGSTGWVAVSGISISITANSQEKEARITGLNVARKRYLRVVATLGGTTPSFAGVGAIVLGGAQSQPVGNA